MVSEDRYLEAFITLRRDNFKILSENRYGVFPAATVGWRISKNFERQWKS
jgi:hypothetical protein